MAVLILRAVDSRTIPLLSLDESWVPAKVQANVGVA